MTWLSTYSHRTLLTFSTPTKWQAAHLAAAKELASPTVRNGYIYTCSVGGYTGAIEPTWPTTIGTTVSDNYATWVCSNVDSYSIPIYIDNALADNGPGSMHCRGYCYDLTKDIRFTSAAGTSLDFFREDAGIYWVEVIDHPDYASIYIYTGKSSDSDASSITTFCPFGDDFETGDFSRWTAAGSHWAIETSTPVYAGANSAHAHAGYASGEELQKTISMGSCAIHGRIYKDNINSVTTHGGIKIFASTSADVTPLIMPYDHNNHFQYEASGSHKDLPGGEHFAAATWYKYDIALDLASSLFRWLWVGDSDNGSIVLKDHNGVTLTLAHHFTSLTLYGDANGHDYYFDSVFVRNYVYPEPTWITAGVWEVPQSPVLSTQSFSNVGNYPSGIDLLQITGNSGANMDVQVQVGSAITIIPLCAQMFSNDYLTLNEFGEFYHDWFPLPWSSTYAALQTAMGGSAFCAGGSISSQHLVMGNNAAFLMAFQSTIPISGESGAARMDLNISAKTGTGIKFWYGTKMDLSDLTELTGYTLATGVTVFYFDMLAGAGNVIIGVTTDASSTCTISEAYGGVNRQYSERLMPTVDPGYSGTITVHGTAAGTIYIDTALKY